LGKPVTATTTGKTIGTATAPTTALPAFVERYKAAFGTDALAGLRIGIYQHSSVARDVMGDILNALGAETVPLAHSDTFIPVDTEAVDPQTAIGRARKGSMPLSLRMGMVIARWSLVRMARSFPVMCWGH